MPAILTAEHAARARRALLDHLAESLTFAAEHARQAAESDTSDTTHMADARAAFEEATDLFDTLAQFDPLSANPAVQR